MERAGGVGERQRPVEERALERVAGEWPVVVEHLHERAREPHEAPTLERDVELGVGREHHDARGRVPRAERREGQVPDGVRVGTLVGHAATERATRVVERGRGGGSIDGGKTHEGSVTRAGMRARRRATDAARHVSDISLRCYRGAVTLGTSVRGTAVGLVWALMACLVVACGGARSTSNRAVAGSAPAVLAAPTFLPRGQRVSARVHTSLARRLPFAVEASSVAQSSATWARLFGASGLDPIRDIDALAVASDAVRGTRRTIIVRFAVDDADVRAALSRMVAAAGAPLDWHDVAGFSVLTLPLDGTVPHSLVLTARHEAVVTPSDDVQRIVTIAREQARLRRAPDDVVEPSLVFTPDELFTAETTDAISGSAGMPPLGGRVSLGVRARPDGGVGVELVSTHDDENGAEELRVWLAQMSALYAESALMRGIGLARPFATARVTRERTTIRAASELNADEARRTLAAASLLIAVAGSDSPAMLSP